MLTSWHLYWFYFNLIAFTATFEVGVRFLVSFFLSSLSSNNKHTTTLCSHALIAPWDTYNLLHFSVTYMEIPNIQYLILLSKVTLNRIIKFLFLLEILWKMAINIKKGLMGNNTLLRSPLDVRTLSVFEILSGLKKNKFVSKDQPDMIFLANSVCSLIPKKFLLKQELISNICRRMFCFIINLFSLW